jgi:hypothetical protein
MPFARQSLTIIHFIPGCVPDRIQQRGNMSNPAPSARRSKRYNLHSTEQVADVRASGGLSAPDAESPPEAKLRRRNTREVNRLLSSTIDWLASLPLHVRPLALATKFPRVANRIALEWKEPSACRRDFEDLVYDNRGNRTGFPPDVLVELLALRDHYYGYDLMLAREA